MRHCSFRVVGVAEGGVLAGPDLRVLGFGKLSRTGDELVVNVGLQGQERVIPTGFERGRIRIGVPSRVDDHRGGRSFDLE